MAEDVLQQKKEEVANVYLKDLKEELGFLKGSIVGMFGSKLKEMMTSDEDMGETFDTSKLNFFEKMLVNISPSTAEKVFTFVKEKQEKIQMAKTDSELDALKAGITVTPTTTTTTTTEEKSKTETTKETAPTTTETGEMTAEDIKKRNAAITSSIKNAKAFPVTIDYGTDKDVLEKKGCPTTIDFDISSQSIKIGNAKLKIKINAFTTQTSFGEAEVKSITVNDIAFKDDAFSLNVTGKGTLTGFIPVSKTETQEISVTKEQLLKMVKPYYENNKTEYDVTLDDGEGNNVPVEIEKTSGDLMTAPIAATAAIGGATTTTEETEEKASTEATEEEQEEEEKSKTKKKNKSENIETGVVAGGGLGLGVLATDKIYKLQEARKIENTIDLKTPEQFAIKMKSQFEDLSEQLAREAANNNKLTQFQAKALSKSAKEFEKVAKNMDEGTLDAVGMLGKLDRKLPASILKTIDPSQAKNLMKLTEADFTLIKAGKEVDAIQGLNKEVITVLRSADNVDEMMSMAKVLTESKGVSGFLKGIKGVAFLDLISTGFDVWVLCEGLDEAEAYKKLNEVRSTTKSEHQRVQFGVSVALTAVGIIATCAAAGSVVPGLGTAVGAALGVIGYAASQAIDIYYDKVEFYLQNEEDFKRQYRTEIKQAIIQSAAAEEWNLNMGERLEASSAKAGTNRAERHLVPFGILLFDKDKLTTTEDAWKALIRQEEYKKKEYSMIQEGFASDKSESEYIKTLSADQKKEFETQKKALNSVIDKRLEYVKLFMYKNKTTKEYQGFVSAMKSGLGVKKIEKILAESKTYYDMKQTGENQYITGAKTIDEYKKAYETKLKQTDAKKFATLEAMREKEQYRFLEIYYGVENFESILDNQKKAVEKKTTTEEIPTTEGEEKTEENVNETVIEPGASTEEKIEEIDAATLKTMETNIDFIKKFYAYKMMGLPIEEQKKLELSIRIIDNKNTEKMLKTGDFDVVNQHNEENVKWYFTNHGILDRMETKVEVSDSVGQNIIYRIATEIHGYTGNNDMKELIAFFAMGKENATGLYYDDKRIVNNDWAIDKGIDIDQFETMTEEEIIKERTRSNNRNAIFELVIDPSPFKFAGASAFGFMDSASMIDTPTENMDDALNKEYRTRVKEIIYQEKGYNKPANKKLVEQKIVTYVTDNTKDNGYIELPYYLIIAAKKAKIGDLQKYLFSNKNGKITACTTKLYIDDKLDFSQTKTDIQKEYISGMKEGLSESADLYIKYVDKAKDKFEALITYDVDELDIPKEYLEIYQAKITERDTLKQSLSVLDPVTAKGELEMKYQEYHDYFENTYIAMLEVISKFKTNIFSSNDLDSAMYHQQIEYVAAQLSTITITKGGEIKIPKDQLTEKQLAAYNTLIGSQYIKGKSIKELASSKKEADQKKAIWGVKQIIKSILETEMLDFGEQGEITGIEHGEQSEKLMALMRGDTVKDRLKLNMSDKEYFDASEYAITTEKIAESKIEIKALTESEEKSTEASNEVEKIIKETEPDLVYPGRGLVTFDPETNVLKSRSENVTIDPQTLKIKGLGTKFATIKELIMAANLMNRFKYKYPGQKDFYFGSGTIFGGYYGIYKPVERGIDDRILTLDAIKEKFPSMLDSNNDVTSDVMSYINSIT